MKSVGAIGEYQTQSEWHLLSTPPVRAIFQNLQKSLSRITNRSNKKPMTNPLCSAFVEIFPEKKKLDRLPLDPWKKAAVAEKRSWLPNRLEDWTRKSLVTELLGQLNESMAFYIETVVWSLNLKNGTREGGGGGEPARQRTVAFLVVWFGLWKQK